MSSNIQFDLPDYLEKMEGRLTERIVEIRDEQRQVASALAVATNSTALLDARVVVLEGQIKWAKRSAWTAFTALLSILVTWIKQHFFGQAHPL